MFLIYFGMKKGNWNLGIGSEVKDKNNLSRGSPFGITRLAK